MSLPFSYSCSWTRGMNPNVNGFCGRDCWHNSVSCRKKAEFVPRNLQASLCLQHCGVQQTHFLTFSWRTSIQNVCMLITSLSFSVCGIWRLEAEDFQDWLDNFIKNLSFWHVRAYQFCSQTGYLHRHKKTATVPLFNNFLDRKKTSKGRKKTNGSF